MVRKALALLIESFAGMEISLEAENGADFLQKLPAHPCDVALLDVQMPVMDGIETARALQAQGHPVRVLALSSHTDETYIIDMIDAGALGYVAKDDEPAELEQAIRSVMRSGSYFTDRVSLTLINRFIKKNPKQDSANDRPFLKEEEIQALFLTCQQKTRGEIADIMCKSERTIDDYRSSLRNKTQARNTTGDLIYALHHGYFEIDAQGAIQRLM